ncbi:hypothetical protein D3C72_2474970 [compost metagenome]
MHGEEFARQFWQRLISRNALQQRFDPAHAFGCDDAELHGKAADGIGKLRSIANEPLSHTDQH